MIEINDSWTIIQHGVSYASINAVGRRLWDEIRRFGLSAEDIAEWERTKCWFPALRNEPEILNLLTYLPDEFKTGELCEPQILWHLPDLGTNWDPHPHVDEEPPWANGRKYLRVVGVALTDSDYFNGGIIGWPKGEHEEDEDIELEASDILIFDPKLPHSGTLNRTGNVRSMIYFRFLESPQ